MKLYTAIKELESFIAQKDLINNSISSVTIAWQIAHALQVINSVVKVLPESNPKDYKWSFNIKKIIVMTLGLIPRGKAKAPSAVRPTEEDLTAEELGKLIKKVRVRLEIAAKCNPKSFFLHPYFGDMKRNEAIRFLEIHTEHHLKIIRAISKAAK